MSNVIFNFNGEKISIQCDISEKMKDICKRFASKIEFDINSLYFLYNGNQLNLELSFEGKANLIDKKPNQMIELVYYLKNYLTEDNPKNKVKEIICPTCGENCRINIKDYKIKLYGCKNNHDKNDILLEEFNFTQNINEFKISCHNFNNSFFKCINCNQNLCSFCKLIHNKEHKIINYGKKDYISNIDNEGLMSYCNDCKTNLCKKCESNHNNHSIIYFQDLALNKNNENKIKEKIEDFRKKLML